MAEHTLVHHSLMATYQLGFWIPLSEATQQNVVLKWVSSNKLHNHLYTHFATLQKVKVSSPPLLSPSSITFRFTVTLEY